MFTNILDRISLVSLSLIIILLPIFFLPFSKIPVDTSKGLILVVGLGVSIISWAAARFSDGKITFHKSPLILSGLLIVVVFFVSAIFSNTSEVSFFGIMLDVGTFWYILAAYLLMLISSMLVRDVGRARMILLGIIAVLGVVFIFQIARFFHPTLLSLGLLGGKTDNLIGSWNTFGIMAGFFGVISLFIIEFFQISRAFKWVLGIMIVISVLLAASVNFTLVWELLGIFSLLIFVYKISITSGRKKEENSGAPFPVFSFAMVMISLLFFMSGQFIGGFLPDRLGLSNVEVRPSASATLDVGVSAIKNDPIIGVGPNRFGELWASYKPQVINSTQFWNTNFSTGSGTLPTMMVNTGILGILSFIIFFALFIIYGVRTLFGGIKKGANSDATLYFLSALYLFIASWFYSTGFVILLLAFALTGAFIGLSSREKEPFILSFLNDPRKSFFFILGLIAVMIISAGISFKYIERFASVSYFGKVFRAQTIEEAEAGIVKATTLHPNDLYLRTANEVYLTKVGNLLNKGNAITEAERTDLQTAFSLAESSAIMAIRYNPKNYLNHQTLGYTYNVASTLGVEGAYEQSLQSFTEASALNPLNPGLKLVIARTHLSAGKTAEAKVAASEALTLKPDYVQALVLLSQIEKELGNTTAAISFAEGALSILPGNQELINYLSSLKGGTPVPPPAISEEETISNDTTSQ